MELVSKKKLMLFAGQGNVLRQGSQGVAWRGQLVASCSTWDAIPQVAPLLQLVAAAPTCPPH